MDLDIQDYGKPELDATSTQLALDPKISNDFTGEMGGSKIPIQHPRQITEPDTGATGQYIGDQMEGWNSTTHAGELEASSSHVKRKPLASSPLSGPTSMSFAAATEHLPQEAARTQDSSPEQTKFDDDILVMQENLEKIKAERDRLLKLQELSEAEEKLRREIQEKKARMGGS